MNKLSIPTKKEIIGILKIFNELLTRILSKLEFKNFKDLTKNLIHDRRFVITFIIILLSIFAHLSSPAFYQDKWVLNKIKNQLENEFDVNFSLPEKVSYSMFPVPAFILKNVEVSRNKNSRKLGEIEQMKVSLSYNKFFDKEKVNIQNLLIKNSKFEIYKDDLDDLIIFFDKEINNKKLLIKDSQVFLKNKSDDIYLILSIENSESFFDKKNIKNFINFNGKIFNNTFNAKISNNYLTKKSNLSFEFKQIGKMLILSLDYLKDKKNIFLELIDSSKSYFTDIKFDKKSLNFISSKKNKNNFSYNGYINFDPFYSYTKIEIEELDLYQLVNDRGFFKKILSENILNNQNLNYKIEINSEKIKNHRLLKNLFLCLTFDQEITSFDNSKIIFDENVEIKIDNSEYISNNKDHLFLGDLNFTIQNDKKIYQFFQTRKDYRKKLTNINFAFKYDFNTKNFFFERIEINGQTNDKIQNIINIYNSEEFKVLNRHTIKKLFNQLIATL